MKKKNTKKITLILGIVLAVLVLGALAAWFFYFKPKTEEGLKKITVIVTHLDKEKYQDHTYEVKTKEEYLLPAVRSVVTVEGSQSTYGLYVLTVDGETVDESKQQWWCITVNGEMGALGIESQPVEDGAAYELALKVGW